MNTSHDLSRLEELAAALCDERITDDEFAELDALLESSPEARQRYHVMVATHQAIAYTNPDSFEALLDGQSPAIPEPHSVPRRRFRASHHKFSISIAVAIAVVASGLLTLHFMEIGPLVASKPDDANPPAADPTFVARLTNWQGDVWGEGTRPPLDDPRLAMGRRLVLEEGVIEIKYEKGATAIIQGPAEFVVLSAKRGRLEVGKLTAHVFDDEMKGFTIETPAADIEDLGTTFGVNVSPSGYVTAHCFEGKIVARSSADDSVSVELARNEAARFAPASGTGASPTFSRLAANRGAFQPVDAFRGSQYEQAVLADKPVAYWRFEHRFSNVEKDLSGNDLHATLAGNYARVRGRDNLGGALVLDGTGGHAKVPDNERLRITGPITIEAWIRSDAMPVAWDRIVEKNYANGYVVTMAPKTAPAFQLTPGHVAFGLNKVFAETPAPVLDGNWHHVAATWDGKQMLVYLDGQPGKPVEFAGPIGVSAADFAIGAHSGGGHRESYDGQIDEVAIYSRALSAEQVLSHFDVGSAKMSVHEGRRTDVKPETEDPET